MCGEKRKIAALGELRDGCVDEKKIAALTALCYVVGRKIGARLVEEEISQNVQMELVSMLTVLRYALLILIALVEAMIVVLMMVLVKILMEMVRLLIGWETDIVTMELGAWYLFVMSMVMIVVTVESMKIL